MMTQLKIIHETLYEYRTKVSFGTHRLILRPREGHDLQVMSMELDITPAHRIEWSRDMFGNSVATVDFTEEANSLRIVNRVTVNTGALPRLAEAPAVSVAFPVVYDDEESIVANAYKTAIYPADAAVLKTWIENTLGVAFPTDAAVVVSTLNSAVKRDIQYRRREEKGVQAPSDTLTNASGSCRDMATLLMEACRVIGIAARFSSGYLDCAASTAGRASTHAWTEVYLPGRGWCGFDPTLGEVTSTKHVAVGVSNHPRAVMPISGRFYGTRADFVGMTVAVKFEKSAFASDS